MKKRALCPLSGVHLTIKPGIYRGREWGKVGDFCRKVLYFCRKTDNFLLLMDNLRRIVVALVYQEEQVQVNPVNISLNCV